MTQPNRPQPKRPMSETTHGWNDQKPYNQLSAEQISYKSAKFPLRQRLEK